MGQLVQKQGYSVIDLCFRRRWNRPRRYLRSATPDDFFSMDGDEFLQHDISGAPVSLAAEERADCPTQHRSFRSLVDDEENDHAYCATRGPSNTVRNRTVPGGVA